MCAWCLEDVQKITDDHVFPDCIGGTRHLVLPACEKCQGSIKRAEQELARKSPFALARNGEVFRVPRRKLKKDAASGAIQPRYLLRRVTEPEDQIGYDEVALQGGQLRQLPSFELEPGCVEGDPPNARLIPARLKGRRRGARPEDVDGLVKEVIQGLSRRPDGTGLVYELPADVFEDDLDQEIAADPAFRPRLFRDVAGRLRIRARNPQEAIGLVWAVQVLASVVGDRLFEHPNWGNVVTVSGETPHIASLKWEQSAVDRVLVKMAYGVAGPLFSATELGHLQRARTFVAIGDGGVPTKEVLPPGSSPDWPDRHVVVVVRCSGRATALLSIYGGLHCVELAESEELRNAKGIVAAVCVRDQRVELRTGAAAAALWLRLVGRCPVAD